MQVFIDTNILLSFFNFTNDDLEELKKLTVLLNEKAVTLYLTDQVTAEFERNREAKIAEALKKLKEQQLNLHFPQICKDFSEYEELRKFQRAYDNAHAKLLDNLQVASVKKELKADEAVSALFAAAKTIKTTPEAVMAARLRLEIGNPPGKNGSLGDALNWELLLAEAPISGDIYFITADRDFVSALDESKFKDYLLNEWTKRKTGSVIFYKLLSSFFKDKFPHIKLASELEKELLIKNLANSKNFASTHAAIAKLSKFTEYTTAEATAILTTATTNHQVGWIATDADVESFLTLILKDHGSSVEAALANAVEKMIAPPTASSEDLDDPPF